MSEEQQHQGDLQSNEDAEQKNADLDHKPMEELKSIGRGLLLLVGYLILGAIGLSVLAFIALFVICSL